MSNQKKQYSKVSGFERRQGDVSALHAIEGLQIREFTSSAWLSINDDFSRRPGEVPRSVVALIRRREWELERNDRRRMGVESRHAESLRFYLRSQHIGDSRSPEELIDRNRWLSAVDDYLRRRPGDRELLELVSQGADAATWAEYERQHGISAAARYKRVHDMKARLKALKN